jgi:hypothetical protein
MKGQTSMIAIVIAVVMVMFIVIFTLTSTLSSETSDAITGEYRKTYATNLIISLLNTKTECGTFSDMLEAAYFGGGECGSGEFEKRLPVYMEYILNATGHTEYRWLIEVEPRGFVHTARQWGDSSVTSSPGYWDGTTIIPRGQSQLDIKLYIRAD